MPAVIEKFRKFLGSKTFYYLILGAFVLEAAWMALSAVYPQAFDEEFHFGLIKVYSHYWLPFLNGQPPDGNAYGAVARDPSFLYHYLMSFPYRLIQLFTDNQTAQIVWLRYLNIGLFALGLVMFRKLLERVNLSHAKINIILFIVIMLPIVPQLAGQVNYDNMLMPLVAWAMLLTIGLIDQINKRDISLQSVLVLLTVCLFATMVKYQFLPIFLAIVIFLGILFGKTHRGSWPDPKRLWGRYKKHPWAKKSLVLIGFVLIFSTFIDRDVVNLVHYHDVAPDCGYVLSAEACNSYPVWQHDYVSHQQVIGHSVHVSSNPVWYLGEWVYWLWYRLFFAINGPVQGFVNYPPLILPIAAFGLLLIGSLVSIIRFRHKLFDGNPYYKFFGLTVLLYLLVLLSQGFLKYRDTAVLQLMNGRYLLPVLIPGMAIGITALGYVLKNRPRVQAVLAALTIICFLQGGGVLTFISRSDASWYWDNQSVRTVNANAQKAVHIFVLEGSKYYSTPKWFFN